MYIIMFVILLMLLIAYFVRSYKNERRLLLLEKLSRTYNIALNIATLGDLDLVVTYDAAINKWDIDSVVKKGKKTDLWNKLSDDDKFDINWELNCYFEDLLSVNKVEPLGSRVKFN